MPIYLERLNAPSLDSKYYRPSGTFNTSPPNSDVQMPNCTMYAYLRSFESCMADEPFPISRNSLGFGNAKTWYSNSPLPKGGEIRDGSIACFDGNYGHVAFVERRIDYNHALISESQYDDDKTLRNYKYWQKRIVELEVGKATLSGVGKLQGFLYLPIPDKRVETGIEVTEDYVNVRTAPEGEILMNGCYCPRGFYKPLEKVFVNGHQWFKLDTNAWVRDGEWLKEENTEVEEMLKDFAAIKRIISKYVGD